MSMVSAIPFNAFAPGDYGPSGEDVRHRFVLAGTVPTGSAAFSRAAFKGVDNAIAAVQSDGQCYLDDSNALS